MPLAIFCQSFLHSDSTVYVRARRKVLAVF
jgi:hypothetical protein